MRNPTKPSDAKRRPRSQGIDNAKGRNELLRPSQNSEQIKRRRVVQTANIRHIQGCAVDHNPVSVAKQSDHDGRSVIDD